MGKRPKRKIVLFLVEGRSDREALRIVISELYEKIDDSIEVFFPTIREDGIERGGDITSRIGVHPRNIEENIYQFFLRDFFDEEKIYPKDISEIVQIVDMDGVYIPDDSVIEGINPVGTEKPYYDADAIICVNASHILKRNECKRENLDYLSSQESIKVKSKKIPYSVFYFSSNLDHFLNNDANLPYQEKCYLADMFAKKFIGNPDGFMTYISSDPTTTIGLNYEESWNYIKQEHNSIHKHTNINILFDRLKEEDLEVQEA